MTRLWSIDSRGKSAAGCVPQKALEDIVNLGAIWKTRAANDVANPFQDMVWPIEAGRKLPLGCGLE